MTQGEKPVAHLSLVKIFLSLCQVLVAARGLVAATKREKKKKNKKKTPWEFGISSVEGKTERNVLDIPPKLRIPKLAPHVCRGVTFCLSHKES